MMAKTPQVLKGRSCYGHLGGTLGGRLFERLVELGWFEQEKSTVYLLTERGKQGFMELGVDIYERRGNSSERRSNSSVKSVDDLLDS